MDQNKKDDYLLRRFLCLGSKDSVYRSNTQHSKFSRNDVPFIERLIVNRRGTEVLDCIKDVSDNNKACRQEPTMFAYAFCMVHGDKVIKNYGYKMLNNICRIPTHLFEFQNYCEELNKQKNNGSGWGRSHRNGISKWYNSYANDAPKLAYLVTKYKKRSKWNHRDIVRLAHVKPKNERIRTILKFIVNKEMDDVVTLHESLDKDHRKVKTFIRAVIEAKECEDKVQLIELITLHGLEREHIPNSFLSEKEVWRVLLRTMPLTAMIRNMGKMTRLGIFDDEHASFFVTLVKEKLESDVLQESKVHPLRILFALRQYQAGKGDKGKLEWHPNHAITTILEKAFDDTVSLQPKSGKRYLLAVSVSGEMKEKLIGSPLTASEAAGAMVHTIVKKEDRVETLLFENNLERPYISTIDPNDNFNSIKRKLELFSPSEGHQITFSNWARDNNNFDVIMVFTDTLTGEGEGHVTEPFDHFCQSHRVGAPNHARVIVAMTGKTNDVVEPCDIQTLHVIGFDPSSPQIINSFISGFNYNNAPMEGVEVY
ncbi:TROVE2 [Mytilus coruscus]|uniref:TROVE2 n=1 Tax=Mytilus coruscus TaxID=42192 RepID=A0A6J8DS86_MYTCO|nr:TROVE2 [Mytilus coruscus]